MSEPVIQSLVARRIWDSRGRPTVEAEITLSDGAVGRGIAPAGASRGSREAIDKRDGGKRFGGFDVRRVSDAARRGSVNAVLVKVNQAERSAKPKRLATKDAAPASAQSSRRVRARPRTRRSFISRIGWRAGQLKVGSFARSERMAKWNGGPAHRGGAWLRGALRRPRRNADATPDNEAGRNERWMASLMTKSVSIESGGLRSRLAR